MCCIFTALALLGPRAAIVVWWLFEPGRWALAFDTFIIPFIGFLFFPLTTLMYVAVYPGGVTGFDYLWLGIALALDVFSAAGGAYGNRDRYRTA
jgi:hypothetical protein